MRSGALLMSAIFLASLSPLALTAYDAVENAVQRWQETRPSQPISWRELDPQRAREWDAQYPPSPVTLFLVVVWILFGSITALLWLAVLSSRHLRGVLEIEQDGSIAHMTYLRRDSIVNTTTSRNYRIMMCDAVYLWKLGVRPVIMPGLAVFVGDFRMFIAVARTEQQIRDYVATLPEPIRQRVEWDGPPQHGVLI